MLSHPMYTPCRIWGVNWAFTISLTCWRSQGEARCFTSYTISCRSYRKKKNDQEDKEREESKRHTLRVSAAVSRNGGEANWEHSLARYWRLGQSVRQFLLPAGKTVSVCQPGAAWGHVHGCAGDAGLGKDSSRLAEMGWWRNSAHRSDLVPGASPPPWVSQDLPQPCQTAASILNQVGLNCMSAPWQQKSWQIHW